MKKRNRKKRLVTKRRKLLAIVVVAVALTIGLSCLAIYLLQNPVGIEKSTNKSKNPLTFAKCIKLYGTHDSNPPICHTPDGLKYTEFKIKGTSYEQCVKQGGKIYDYEDGTGGCSGKDKRFIQKLQANVSTYNECQEKYPRYIVASVTKPYICVDKNGRMYFAGGQDRTVNSFDECKKADGIVAKGGTPRKCYYDNVVYWQILKPNQIYLNLPVEIHTFSDCVTPGMAINVKMIDGVPTCTAFNQKKYEYDGPEIKTFEDCARVMQLVLASSPPQCYGPDGTHYVGTR